MEGVVLPPVHELGEQAGSSNGTTYYSIATPPRSLTFDMHGETWIDAQAFAGPKDPVPILKGQCPWNEAAVQRAAELRAADPPVKKNPKPPPTIRMPCTKWEFPDAPLSTEEIMFLSSLHDER